MAEPATDAPAMNGKPEEEQAAEAAESAVTSAEGEQEQPEEEPWRKRLWFVRMPKPPEAGAIKVLEQEVDTYRTQLSLITEALNVKKVERDSAREATRSAREAFSQSRDAYNERAAPVKELQQQRQDAAASANKLKESFSDLLVRSEAELEEQLRGLHYRIEHESITLNEEKKALATIKKLEQQRERVREYEASASLFAESRAKRSELQEAVKEYEGELRALRQEMDLQRQILDKLREHERGIDKEVQEIIDERRRWRDKMEDAYQRMNALKKEQWERNNAFYTNRSFSRDVRKMVAEGKLEEARDACAAQAAEATAQLAGNAKFAAEYFALWEQQRKAPVLLPSDDVDGDAAPAGKKGGKKGGAKAEVEPVDPSKKAEATIAALLAQARDEARRAKAEAAEAEAAERAQAAAAAAASAAAAEREQHEGAAAAAAPREVVGLEPEEAAAAARAAHHAAKAPRPAARPVVEPVVVPPENFELPAAIKLKEKTPSSQELKELERERQRQAREEAERRKARKAADKERKRARQEQLAAEAAAAAARAAAAAAAAQAAATAAAQAAADSEAAPSDDTSSDGGRGEPAEGSSVAPAPTASEARKRRGGKAPAPVTKLLQPKPAARRPAPKPSGLMPRQLEAKLGQLLRSAGLKDEWLIAAASVAVLLFAILAVTWTAYKVAA